MLLDRFRRTTRDGRWLAEIDGLRFLAIAAVVLFHMKGELQERSGVVLAIEPRYQWLMGLINNGDRGVRLFFVISGFILALPFARQYLLGGQRVSLRKFYLRRVTRLEPPYLLAICLTAAVLLVFYRGAAPPGFFRHLLATCTYTHGLVYGSDSWVDPVTWSLEVEIQFYVLAPLFMLLLKVKPAAVRRVLLVAVMLASGVVQQHLFLNARGVRSIGMYVQYFLAGLLLADLYTLEFAKLKSSWWWDGVGACCLLLMFVPGHDWRMEETHVLLPYVFCALFVAVFKSRSLRACFANPWIAVCGGMCYSIYLLHLTLIAVLFHVTRRAIIFPHDFLGNFIVQLGVTVLPALAISSLFFLAVEKPCMDPAWPAKLWKRLTGRRNAETDALDSSGIS